MQLNFKKSSSVNDKLLQVKIAISRWKKKQTPQIPKKTIENKHVMYTENDFHHCSTT